MGWGPQKEAGADDTADFDDSADSCEDSSAAKDGFSVCTHISIKSETYFEYFCLK